VHAPAPFSIKLQAYPPHTNITTPLRALSMQPLSFITFAALILGINGQTNIPTCALACATSACGATLTDLNCLCVASGAAIGQCVLAHCTGTDLSVAMALGTNCSTVPGFTPAPRIRPKLYNSDCSSDIHVGELYNTHDFERRTLLCDCYYFKRRCGCDFQV
jgi:CFEM domain